MNSLGSPTSKDIAIREALISSLRTSFLRMYSILKMGFFHLKKDYLPLMDINFNKILKNNH